MQQMKYLCLTGMMLSVAYCIQSCDPPPPVYSGNIQLNATVLNPKDTINLGDTVTIYFEVPDSADIIGSGTKEAIFGAGKDGVVINNSVNKIDTFSGFSFDPYTPDCKQVATVPGYITWNGILNFKADSAGRLYTYYSMTPLNTGVYFFWDKQNGYASLNNGKYNTTTSFTLGNINRHFNLLIDNTRVSDSMSLFLSDKGLGGHEVYAFYVK
jgi:hypothetical protein